MKIALSGASGTGKTTLARTLAGVLHLPLLEENLGPMVKAMYGIQRASREVAKPQAVCLAQKAYFHECEVWLNQRANNMATLAGFVADRWAIDILTHWLAAGIARDDDSVNSRLIRHVQRQALALDAVIVPPLLTLSDEVCNEEGGLRRCTLSTRLHSHALTRGLLEQIAAVRKIYLPGQPATVESRVKFVLAALPQPGYPGETYS